MNQNVNPSTEVLNSWKDIARYLDRGVRTVQRWELLGLPVHRPSGRGRSAVFALKSELDVWLRSCPTEAHQEALSNGHATLPESKAAQPRKLDDNHATQLHLTAQLILESRRMREELLHCRQQLHVAIEQLHKSLIQMSFPAPPGRVSLPSSFAVLDRANRLTEGSKASN